MWQEFFGYHIIHSLMSSHTKVTTKVMPYKVVHSLRSGEQPTCTDDEVCENDSSHINQYKMKFVLTSVHTH